MAADLPTHRPQGLATTPSRSTSSLLALLARLPPRVELLSELHQRAIEVTGGTSSLLFEQTPHDKSLQPSSGSGAAQSDADFWRPGAQEAGRIGAAFNGASPLAVMGLARDMPRLAARLGADAALLLPLIQGQRRLGLLAIGFAGQAPGREILTPAIEVSEGLVTALELLRLRRNEELQRELRQLVDEVSGQLSTTMDLKASLALFCMRATAIVGARRTEVWLLDRRSRNLSLQAASDDADAGTQGGTEGSQIDIDANPTMLPALALKSSRAAVHPEAGDPSTSTISIPLRGRRRALGTLIFEGLSADAGGEANLLDRADEVGLQLSATIENLQLLEDLIRSRRELENTFDSIAHLVVVCDRRGLIVHANRAFVDRVGLTRDDAVNRPLAEFIGPELIAWLDSSDSSRQEPAATVEVIDPMLKSALMVTVTDLRDRDGQSTGRVLVARDLTPESRLEVEREELRKRLTQSEKLAALGQFVAGIAHELNNPLQGVLGHLELLRVTGAFPKQLRREVATIYREADRAAKIVRNLLVFAGSRRLTKRAVSLTAVLQKVLALRLPAFRACDIEVVRHYDDQLPRVHSDPLLLHQVFLNIVMNAEQAIAGTGQPGRIEIATRVNRDTMRVVTTVRDTGPGISPDALTRIFEPFYTTKEVGKGTGLGLAIAYGIMQEHGGLIAASNHPDGGAIFTVEIPANVGRAGTGRARHSARNAEA